MKPFENLTNEQKERLAQFCDRLVEGVKVREELNTKTNAEVGEMLMRHIGDDMEIESPSAILIEEAAKRLGYDFGEEELMDNPMHKFTFVGCLRWRYRWQHVAFALKVLWNAIKGYHLTVECHDDEDA